MPKLVLVLLFIFPLASLADLVVSNAWIRNLPPSVPVRAGYMEILNPATEAVSIKSITSPAFDSIEIHQTIMKDGVMSMEPVINLTIEANSKVVLKPGGIHLMLIHPAEPIIHGDEIRIDITLSDESHQSVSFTVKK